MNRQYSKYIKYVLAFIGAVLVIYSLTNDHFFLFIITNPILLAITFYLTDYGCSDIMKECIHVFYINIVAGGLIYFIIGLAIEKFIQKKPGLGLLIISPLVLMVIFAILIAIGLARLGV